MSNSISLEIRRHRAPDSPWTYELLDQRQREIGRRVSSGGPGALLLSELAPVITLGRRTPETDLLLNDDHLRSKGISKLRTDRGGLATYHGPGQWVLFPVDRLEKLTGDPRGVRRAVEKLLQIAISVASEVGVQAEAREGAELGVWSRKGKLAAVGIHVEDGILFHGMSLNVFRTPESFQGVRPCGLDAPVDFLSERVDDGFFNDVGKALGKIALEQLWGGQRSF